MPQEFELTQFISSLNIFEIQQTLVYENESFFKVFLHNLATISNMLFLSMENFFQENKYPLSVVETLFLFVCVMIFKDKLFNFLKRLYSAVKPNNQSYRQTIIQKIKADQKKLELSSEFNFPFLVTLKGKAIEMSKSMELLLDYNDDTDPFESFFSRVYSTNESSSQKFIKDGKKFSVIKTQTFQGKVQLDFWYLVSEGNKKQSLNPMQSHLSEDFYRFQSNRSNLVESLTKSINDYRMAFQEIGIILDTKFENNFENFYLPLKEYKLYRFCHDLMKVIYLISLRVEQQPARFKLTLKQEDQKNVIYLLIENYKVDLESYNETSLAELEGKSLSEFVYLMNRKLPGLSPNTKVDVSFENGIYTTRIVLSHDGQPFYTKESQKFI